MPEQAKVTTYLSPGSLSPLDLIEFIAGQPAGGEVYGEAVRISVFSRLCW